MLNPGSQHLINLMNKTSQPMFSVVITTYNRASLLTRAVKSLLSQTEKDWEAIIVDDGSTDDTYKEIFPYLDPNSGIRYLKKRHTGEARSKNYGIKASRGKFITFLDSDDEYAPVHLESRKDFLLQNPDIKFLYGGVTILGNQYVPDKNDPSSVINLNDCVIGGTFFIEKMTLLSLNGFINIILGPDSDLFERARKKGTKMAEIKAPTYIYHHENQDSITNMLYRRIKDP